MRSALRGFYRFIGAALARIIPHDSRINHRHLSISDLASSPHRHQNAECRVMLRRRSINCLAETRDSHHVIQPSITPVSKENQRKRISTSICIDTCYFSNLILSPPPPPSLVPADVDRLYLGPVSTKSKCRVESIQPDIQPSNITVSFLFFFIFLFLATSKKRPINGNRTERRKQKRKAQSKIYECNQQ